MITSPRPLPFTVHLATLLLHGGATWPVAITSIGATWCRSRRTSIWDDRGAPSRRGVRLGALLVGLAACEPADPVASLVGCYAFSGELSLEPFHTPAWIALDDYAFGSGWHLAHVEARGGRSTHQGRWKLMGRDSLELGWGNGFVGFAFELVRTEAGFRGAATYQSDVHPFVQPLGPAAIRRVECPHWIRLPTSRRARGRGVAVDDQPSHNLERAWRDVAPPTRTAAEGSPLNAAGRQRP